MLCVMWSVGCAYVVCGVWWFCGVWWYIQEARAVRGIVANSQATLGYQKTIPDLLLAVVDGRWMDGGSGGGGAR